MGITGLILSCFFNLTTALAATLSMQLTDVKKNEPLSNVVITLHANKQALPVTALHLNIMDQINKTLVPHVLVITVGTSVSFPNKDDIRHHLYSFDKPKPFELPLYEGTPTNPITFDKIGIVRLGCNIHDWMRGYIYIVDTPLFALSDQQGNLKINHIPSGEYTMEVWHPRIKGENAYISEVIFTTNDLKEQSLAINVRKVRKIKRHVRSRRSGY